MSGTFVVALTYQIKHEPSIDYGRAEPLDHEDPGFRIRVEDERVRFEFKDHYSTEREARKAIEGYVRQWEFTAGLRWGPDVFSLKFLDSEIEHRNPQPGVLPPISIRSGAPQISITLRRGLPCYPQPPSGVKLTPDVESMYGRYMGYRQGKEPLTSMAYFCLTVLEKMGAKKVATEYRISRNVLDQIGRLSSRKGGSQARKADGISDSLTTQEARFLEESTKALIERVAQWSYEPNCDYPKITLSDLPHLESSS